jgi:hypothetical protein
LLVVPNSALGHQKMTFDRQLFAIQFPIVKHFVYHVVYYRVLSKIRHDHQLKNEFWALTIDAHLLRASPTGAWCLVQTQKTLTGRSSLRQIKMWYTAVFATGYFASTKLTQETWLEYWTSVVDFRNKYTAHRNG